MSGPAFTGIKTERSAQPPGVDGIVGVRAHQPYGPPAFLDRIAVVAGLLGTVGVIINRGTQGGFFVMDAQAATVTIPRARSTLH